MAVKLISLGKIFAEDIKFEEINCDDEDIIKLEYVTKYHVNLKTAETSIARTYEDLNEMTITLEIPKSDYNNESFKKILKWSSLPVQDENYYRDLAINMIIAGENEKTVLFSHGRITVDVKHNTKADYVTVEIMVKQKEDMYRGVVFGLELYETYRESRDKVDNPVGVNVVVPVVEEDLWDDDDDWVAEDEALDIEKEFVDTRIITDAGKVFRPLRGVDPNETQKNALYKINNYYSSNKNLKANIDNGGTSIFAFEGAGAYAVGGTNNAHPRNRYGAMMVIMKGKDVTYITLNASTLPDLLPGSIVGVSTTCAVSGVYYYQTGIHNTYTALVPEYTFKNKTKVEVTQMSGWYKIDGKLKVGNANGINIHAGGDVNTGSNEGQSWSQGCQIIWYKDYVNFGKKAGFLKQSAAAISSGSSDAMTNAVGTKHAISKYVYYVLDRTLMPKDYYGNDRFLLY